MSSDGHYARKSLRECDGLIEALLQVTRAVIGKAEMGKCLHFFIALLEHIRPIEQTF